MKNKKILDEIVRIGMGIGLYYLFKKKPFTIVVLTDTQYYSNSYPEIFTEQTQWIADNKIDVKDEFLGYVRPLIGEDWISVSLINGRQRFAKFKPIFAEKKLPDYVPEAY